MSWRGLDHGTIYEMVVNGGQGIGVSDAAETAWGAANQAILDAERDIGAALQASRAEWEGSGADAMRTAYSPLGQWAVNAATTAAKTAGGVGDQAVLAMETKRLVADNPPPQNVGQHLHSFFGGLDGDSVYLDRSAAVDRLMTGYEGSSVANEERFNTWSVPPTVVVTPAAAGPSGPGGPGGGGVGAMPDAGGLGPAGGSGIASALAPGTGAAGAGGGALPGGAGSPAAGPGAAGAGTGAVPGAPGSPVGGSGAAGVGGSGSGGTAGGAGTGRSPAGVSGPGVGGSGVGGPGAGPGGPGAAGSGRPGPVGPGAGGPATTAGGRGLGTGGVAHPSQRPLGSPGGSGTGPGPWSRAGAEAGRSPAGAAPLRPTVPTAPPRTSAPDWRSVLLPPEREPATTSRAPGETAARGAGPGAPGGSAAAPAAAQGSGPRGTGSPGMHGAPMMGGAGGTQPESRRRASYLIDDSDAFVDRRWFTEPVITPDDPL